MKTRDFILLAYGAFDRRISGRTLLQKRVYFLSEMLDENHGFSPHYYGPYSSQVAEANSELKALGFIEEDRTVYGWNHSGFEMARYDYSLTEDGLKLLERKKKEYPDEWKQIYDAANRIKGAGTVDYMELALAAKAYFILTRQGGTASKETIKTVAQKFGWTINELELEKAIDFLNKIHLAGWE